MKLFEFILVFVPLLDEFYFLPGLDWLPDDMVFSGRSVNLWLGVLLPNATLRKNGALFNQGVFVLGCPIVSL